MLAQGQKWLFNRFTWLYLLLCFPFIDYTLRNIIHIPVISSLWDEGLLLLLFIICMWRLLETNRTLPSVKTPMIAFIVLGVAHFVINMYHFAINVEGFRAVYQYLIAFFIGYYFLERRSQLVVILKIAIVVGALVGLYGIYQYAIGVEVPSSWTDSSENLRSRAFSIVQSPNILGSYMALMSPIAFGLFLTDKTKRRWLWIILCFIMLGALLFTFSRGAWLALAGALAVFSLFWDRRVFISFLALAVLAAVFVPPVKSRITNLFSSTYIQKSSKDGRIDRWSNAYDQMRDEPFFGAGLGRYGGAVGERRFGTTYVDSYYFKTLAEMGLLGISIYFWLMGSLTRNAYRIWRKHKGKSDYFLLGGLFAGIVAVIIHNAVENIFEVPFMNTFFWLIAGMLLSWPYLKMSGGKEEDRLA